MEQRLSTSPKPDHLSRTRQNGSRSAGDQDAGLASRLRAGDRAAFDAIYDAYSTRLFSLCRQMLRDPASSDLLSEASRAVVRASTGLATTSRDLADRIAGGRGALAADLRRLAGEIEDQTSRAKRAATSRSPRRP
jgi:hypothetical protein